MRTREAMRHPHVWLGVGMAVVLSACGLLPTAPAPVSNTLPTASTGPDPDAPFCGADSVSVRAHLARVDAEAAQAAVTLRLARASADRIEREAAKNPTLEETRLQWAVQRMVRADSARYHALAWDKIETHTRCDHLAGGQP